MQVLDENGANGLVSVPGAPLLGSGLSLLLWPAGVIQADEPQVASGGFSAVVDLGEVVEGAPTAHAEAIE